jgi:osmotically-inducible protein OsmY
MTDVTVRSALQRDPRTGGSAIEVAAEGGVVTLTGRVETDEIKDAAGEVARKQPGVLSVINELRVSPGDRDKPLGPRHLVYTQWWQE